MTGCHPKGQRFGVENAAHHPSWNGKVSQGYDIALIRLDRPVEFSIVSQTIFIIKPDAIAVCF